MNFISGRISKWITAVAAIVLTASCTPGDMVDRLAGFYIFPKTVRPAEYSARTSRDNFLTTSDGVVLAADVHAPVGLAKTPTILIRIPFNNTFSNRIRSDLVGRFWARRGYTVVVQGTRGRYRSGGKLYPAVNEKQDGIATIEWLRTRPWFDGRFAMWGGSAFGHTQWAVSGLGSAGPTAYAIQITSTDYYETFHPGGAFALESALYWALISPPTEDRETSFEEIDRGANGWPLIEADDRAFQDVAFFNDWVEHASRDDYWKVIDGENRARKISAPVLLIGGWFDPFLPTLLNDFTTIVRENPDKLARKSRLVIGPYTHAHETEVAGKELNEPYRMATVEPTIRWFDIWLGDGDQADLAAPVRLYVMGDNIWRDENEWPLARTVYTPFYLSKGGGLYLTPPDGKGDSLAYVYDPNMPVPTRGGAMLGARAGIMLQEAAGVRNDVLSFHSQILQSDTEVTGTVSAELFVSTDAPSTDFTVMLLDVHPDGRAFNVTDGILRRGYKSGQTNRVRIDLVPTSFVFKAGHKLRIDVSSSNFPHFDRNPNTGGNPALETEPRVAHQVIHLSRNLPSNVILPIIPR